MSEPRPNATNALRRRKRWWFVAAGLVFVVLLHGLLLRGVSGWLIVDAPHAGGDLLAVRNDPESMAAVAELFAAGRFERVLVLPNQPRLTDKLGVTASSFDEARNELTARGVPATQIEAVAEPTDDLRLRVRRVCEFVRGRPERKVTLVAERFEGRAVQSRVTAELDAADAAQIAVASRPPLQFDERRWWTNRRAVQGVFRGYLTWASAVWGGESDDAATPIDWRAFEAALAQGEKP